MKLGFMGPKGTFSHEAAHFYIGEMPGSAVTGSVGAKSAGDGYILFEFNTMDDVMRAVASGEIDEGIVPIENSIEGAVNATLDMLSGHLNLMIKSEFVMEVVENLLVKPGTLKTDIKCICSHPQAIGQCRKFLSHNYSGVEIQYIFSTALGALQAAGSDGSIATVGSANLAGEYRLEILEPGIQDEENNHTRFVVISDRDSLKTGNDKTSMVFSTENQPGSLYRILDIFNLWDVNMVRIESRPAREELGKYIFFVDIMGHREDDDVADALTMIRKKCSFFKLLGSYPVYQSGK